MDKAYNKRKQKLGMTHSTAYYRLLKDIIFDFVLKNDNKCFRCGKPMCREDFSIEHKEGWLNSDKPMELFFSLENISYSHKRCNSVAGGISSGNIRPKGMTPIEKRKYKRDWMQKSRKKNLGC